MECCGNPFHDIPQYLPLVAPFLGALVLWLRARFAKKCDCGHEHADKHEHA